MGDRAYHLWRRFPGRPSRLWACTLAKDSTVEDGYRVSDFDPAIADAGFLHRMADMLRTPQRVRSSVREGSTILETARYINPGEPGHFGVAVRMIPDAVLRGEGRQ